MRWPWQRRTSGRTSGGETTHTGESPSRARRGGREDHAANAVLVFAQAYLAATGARTRWNGEALSVTLPDGTSQTYTPDWDHADPRATVLVPGGEALAAMLDDAHARSRIGALVLPRSHDPESLVRDALVAAPKSCGRCATQSEQAKAELCDQCPLRGAGNRFVVATLPKRRSLRTQREAMATSVELAYRVSARDRGGRMEEVVRLAFDAEGQRVEALTPAQVHSAGVGALSANAATLARAAVARAEEALRPALDAAATALRTRSAEVYRRRQDDLTSTCDRLRREQPDDEQAILQSLQRELSALADTFAVEVHATLESIYFVAAPVTEMAWHAVDGRETRFRVDAGRGCVVAACASCGGLTGRGGICAQGHVTCASCGPGCNVCHGTRAASAADEGMTAPRTKTGATALTVEHLDALAQLMPRLWVTSAAWMLAHDGYHVRDADPNATVWHATSAGHEVIIMRLPAVPGLAIGGEDVRRAAHIANESGAQGLLFSLASSSGEAEALAEALDVALWDRARLGKCLAGVASEQTRALGPTRGEAKERVAAAITTRAALLDAIAKAAAVLDVSPSGERIVGLAALSAAIAELSAMRQSAEQAILAWETLVADWLAIFPERVTPTGGLVIEADKKALRELRERATHLSNALASVFEQLGRASRPGEMGYDGWCAALIEEFTARCGALRARVARVDPAEWEDARRARNGDADVAAARADQAWRHAAARTAKAYAQVARLANHR